MGDSSIVLLGTVKSHFLGLLKMMDEAGQDSKILAVPVNKFCLETAHIQTLDDVEKIVLDRITHFFEQYKALEPNKWVKVDG